MYSPYLIAASVGILWAIAPIVMIDLVRKHGAVASNSIRVVAAALIFIIIGFPFVQWELLTQQAIIDAILSGVIGVLLGDSLLYFGLKSLGPRRNTLIFSSNIIFSILLGVLFLKESYSFVIWMGSSFLFLGILIAVLYAPSRSGKLKPGHVLGHDDVTGRLWVGICAALLAAFAQAYGMFVLKPHLENGVDILALTITRLSSAAIFCLPVVLRLIYCGKFHYRDSLLIGLGGWVFMGVGSFFIQYALKEGDLGLVNMLSATSPIWVLPLLWWKTRTMPHYIAWFGAAVGMLGLFCIFMPQFIG